MDSRYVKINDDGTVPNLDFDLDTFIIEDNVDELLKKENEEDLKKILRDTAQINEIQDDMRDILGLQKEALENTDDVIEDSVTTAEQATLTIGEAKKSFFSSILLRNTFIAGLVGMVIGGPLGGLLAVSTGGSIIGSAIGGGVIGSGVIGGTTYGVTKDKVKE
jgi:hypothetical protein